MVASRDRNGRNTLRRLMRTNTQLLSLLCITATNGDYGIGVSGRFGDRNGLTSKDERELIFGFSFLKCYHRGFSGGDTESLTEKPR